MWRAALALTASVFLAGCGRRLPHIPVITPLVSPLLAPFEASPPPRLFQESFTELDAARWREVEVQGRTTYTVERLDNESCLKAYSHPGASVLLHLQRFNPHTYEWLSWRWRVERFVDGEDLATKPGSDASARVYVYFDTPGLPWQKRNLDYVWSQTLPVGTVLDSAYSDASKIIVAESGTAAVGQWRTASRNIEDDYRRCFGGNPPKVVAIGLMVDADSTRTEALAYFDDVQITQEAP